MTVGHQDNERMQHVQLVRRRLTKRSKDIAICDSCAHASSLDCELHGQSTPSDIF